MGEIADMMLEGILCQECGDVIDVESDDSPGHPVTCDGCRRRHRTKAKKPVINAASLGGKLLRTLQAVSGWKSPMYDGMPVVQAPAQLERLRRHGLVRFEQPHNPVHRERAVITAEGLAVLAQVTPPKSK
ncbi:MAG: hypothetical protein RJA36_1407 [Pseudomonadota bacterium]|jgi:hypothetical protein